MGKKSTEAEYETRVRAVYELLLSGMPRPDIIQHAAENWDVESRQTSSYIRSARAELKKHSELIKKDAMTMAIARREALYYLAMDNNDFRLALEVDKELSKLLGLYEPAKQEIVIKDSPSERLSSLLSGIAARDATKNDPE